MLRSIVVLACTMFALTLAGCLFPEANPVDSTPNTFIYTNFETAKLVATLAVKHKWRADEKTDIKLSYYFYGILGTTTNFEVARIPTMVDLSKAKRSDFVAIPFGKYIIGLRDEEFLNIRLADNTLYRMKTRWLNEPGVNRGRVNAVVVTDVHKIDVINQRSLLPKRPVSPPEG